MTTIKDHNQLLMRMTSDPRPVALLERSASQFVRLEKLIADLMDVSKINALKNLVIKPIRYPVRESGQRISFTTARNPRLGA